MKYIITRTSTWDEDTPPIKGVQKEMLPYTHPSFYGNLGGTEELMEAWTMEINTLEELHQFIKDCKHPVVVSNPNKYGSGFQLPEIEIYDDYRE